MTAEERRLPGRAFGRGALEKMGTVPERAAVGDGARGLRPERRRLELSQPRSGALASPTNGARTASPASRMIVRRSASRWRSGTGAIRSSRSASSASTNSEGNHGEDVKEYYFYLDSTPTHSYMRYLYKYPQRPFPYLDLVETNARRGRAASWSTS